MSQLPAPIFFGPDSSPRFGCLHGADIVGARLGVVMCSPFGREEACAHRSLKHLANAIARSALPVLRFDYDGCGDSAGDDLQADRVSRWIGSVCDAVDELKRLTGVPQVALVGVRLGALLAALATRGRTDVVGLATVVPVVRGRSFVREFAVLASASVDTRQETESAAFVQAGGFLLTDQTRADLSALDLATTPLTVPRVLIIERDDLPGSSAWPDALRRQGITVDTTALPGYGDMMLDPHATRIPEIIIDHVTAWLKSVADLLPPAPETCAPPSRQCNRVVIPACGDARAVTETANWIDGRLFAILSHPADQNPELHANRQAVLLLNAGATCHVGPSRAHVVLARLWAARGVWVLRVDIAGLGESPAPNGSDENIVYPPHALDDVRSALASLRTASAGAPCTVVGLCSGAYHAFKAAAAGDDLQSIIAINPLTFFWKTGMPLDPPMPAHRVIGEAARYRRAVFDPARWRKWLRGDANVGRAIRVVSIRLRHALENQLREVARLLQLPLNEDLGADLDSIVRHKIRLQFVFADDEPGNALLWSQGGSVARRLARNHQMRIVVIDQADHTFTRFDARGRLIRALDELVFSAPP